MEDIDLLQEILKRKLRNDLAEIINGSIGKINESTTYGSYYGSLLSSYEIYSPLDKYLQLKKLSKEDIDIILESTLDIYQPEENGPEITYINFKLLKEGLNIVKPAQPEESIDTPKSIRTFISYSTKDKILAGQIKYYLSEFGVEVFLAHEDISPSLEWQDIILQNLESTDIFLPLITKNFDKSKWTDQESGFVIARNKFIIPISIEGNPHGFLGKYQSLKFKETNPYLNVIAILKTILNNEKFQNNMLSLIIDSISRSTSFDDAGVKTELLINVNIETKTNMDKLINSIIKSHQAKYSFRARKALDTIFTKNKNLVNKDSLTKLNDSMEDYKFNLS